jgi:hypothetical protein
LKFREGKFLHLWIQRAVRVTSCALPLPIAYNVDFLRQLKKVNPCGPSLEFKAGFSISETSKPQPFGFDGMDIAQGKTT